MEAPLRVLTVTHVSAQAAIYLRAISLAESSLRVGTHGRFTAVWWEERKAEALGALTALRWAIEEAGEIQHGGRNG